MKESSHLWGQRIAGLQTTQRPTSSNSRKGAYLNAAMLPARNPLRRSTDSGKRRRARTIKCALASAKGGSDNSRTPTAPRASSVETAKRGKGYAKTGDHEPSQHIDRCCFHQWGNGKTTICCNTRNQLRDAMPGAQKRIGHARTISEFNRSFISNGWSGGVTTHSGWREIASERTRVSISGL